MSNYNPYGQKSAWKGPNQWPYVNDTSPQTMLRETFATQPAVIENYIVQPGVPWWAERDYRRRGNFLVDSTGQKMFWPWGRQWKYQSPAGPYDLVGGNFYPSAAVQDVGRWQRKIERSGPGRRPATPMYYSMLQNFYSANPGASNLF